MRIAWGESQVQEQVLLLAEKNNVIADEIIIKGSVATSYEHIDMLSHTSIKSSPNAAKGVKSHES